MKSHPIWYEFLSGVREEILVHFFTLLTDHSTAPSTLCSFYFRPKQTSAVIGHNTHHTDWLIYLSLVGQSNYTLIGWSIS